MSLATIGNPCAIEPFDKEWGVGVSGMAEDPSPFPRINKQLKWLEELEPTLDVERAELITEAYKRYAASPQIIKVARGLAHILENVSINIWPGELIVGEMAAPPLAYPLFPEFSYNWLCAELNDGSIASRKHDRMIYTQESTERALALQDFWRGNTVEERINARLTNEERKGSQVGAGIYFVDLYVYDGVGHIAVDYEKLLKIGYGGIRKEVEAHLAPLSRLNAGDIAKIEFYEAQLIVLDGVADFIHRYADLATKMAGAESDRTRKAELMRIAANCIQVASGPARDFWEAIQLWWFATNFILIESNGHSVTYGRFDVIFKEFYLNDIKNNATSREFAQELIESSFLKMHQLLKARGTGSTVVASGTRMGGTALDVGGVDANGHDVTNDLSYMILDAHAHTQIPNPWMGVRFHADTPWEFKVKVFNVIRIGTGEPKVFNDAANIAALLSTGKPIEHARNYVGIGCVEPSIPGKEYGWHDAAYFNMAKVFQLSINNGCCIGCNSGCKQYAACVGAGKTLGPPTGKLTDFTSFDQVLHAYDVQMKYWCERMVAADNIMDLSQQSLKPVPYLSLLVDDCIAKGVDISAGGAHYNHTGCQGVGTGTVADGMATIKQLVFDETKVTAKELLQALEDNWVGHEPLYALVNSDRVHHYGNDDKYADELANSAISSYIDNLKERPNARGGTFCPGVFSVSMNVAAGLFLTATPDGRRAGEPISDCLGPVHTPTASHDVKGPTAIANSVASLDQTRITNGTILNWKFTPNTVSGTTGRDNLIAVNDVYFEHNGLESQFNIVSKDTLLKAQAKPDNYRNLLVRVAGYSAYFTELDKQLQDDLIARTELSFD